MLLVLCGILGDVPGLAIACTKLVVELESIPLLVASALAISDMMEGCVASVCAESILVSEEEGPASVDDKEVDGDEEASTVDKSMPIPAPINALVLSSNS